MCTTIPPMASVNAPTTKIQNRRALDSSDSVADGYSTISSAAFFGFGGGNAAISAW